MTENLISLLFVNFEKRLPIVLFLSLVTGGAVIGAIWACFPCTTGGLKKVQPPCASSAPLLTPVSLGHPSDCCSGRR